MKHGTLAAVLITCLFACQAEADVQGHCEAYATDFANGFGVPKGDAWQHKYEIALKSCVAQYTPEEKPVTTAPARKVKTASVETAPAPAVIEEQATPAIRKKPKLEKGSEAWLDYCDKKYRSFNRDTGTYQSMTGKERPCLVTAD